MPGAPFTLLTKRRFGPFFVVQFLGAFNDNVLRFAMLFLASFTLFRAHPETAAQLGTIAAGLFMLPYFFFSALAGQLADGMDKAKLIRIIKGAEVLIMSLSLVGFWRESVPLLLLTLFLMGVHSTFFGPVKYALMPQHLQRDEILAGTGLIEAGTFLAILSGQLLAGLIEPRLAGLVATGLALLGFLTSLAILPAPSVANGLKIEANILKSTWQGSIRAKHDKEILRAVFGISWFFAAGAVLLTQFAPLVSGTFHAAQSVATLFLLIFSISIAAGSLSISWLLKGQVTTKYVPATAYTMGAFFIIFWLACSRFSMAPGGGIADFMAASGGWFVLLALIGIAFAGGMFIVPLYAVLQTQSHADDCAQTIASNNIYNALFAVLLVIVSTMMLSWGLTVPQLIGALGVETLLGAVLVYGKRGRE